MSAGVGTSVVQVGSCVRVQGDENESEYVIVDPAEADASAGRVSSESPMGRAVLGRVPGELATVHAPGGDRLVRIVAIGAASAEAAR
jgi:transcription elongation factor GreA